MSIVFDWSRLPDGYRQICEPIFDEWMHLFPSWIHYVTVQFYDEKLPAATEEYSADTDGKQHYRMAKIRIRPTLLKSPLALVEQVLVHEILHIPQSTYDRLVDEVLALVKDKTVRKFYSERLVEAREAMTEDVAWSLIHGRDALRTTQEP